MTCFVPWEYVAGIGVGFALCGQIVTGVAIYAAAFVLLMWEAWRS